MKFFERRDLIARLPLSLQHKFVLMRLQDFSGKRGVAFPSQERLAEDASLKPRQVRKYLTDLKAKGLISVKRRRQETSVLQLNWERIEHEAQDRHHSATHLQSKTGTTVPVIRNQDRHSRTVRPALQDRKTGTPGP